VTACLGFLAGILWMDLIFDVQTERGRKRGDQARQEALAVAATYYRHATGGARPMERLIAIVMIAAVASIIVQLSGGTTPRWVGALTLIATSVPIVLAILSTLPSAIALGATPDSMPDARARLARRILRDHLVAWTGILLALILQLVFGC
jgi:hypothetical protein